MHRWITTPRYARIALPTWSSIWSERTSSKGWIRRKSGSVCLMRSERMTNRLIIRRRALELIQNVMLIRNKKIWSHSQFLALQWYMLDSQFGCRLRYIWSEVVRTTYFHFGRCRKWANQEIIVRISPSLFYLCSKSENRTRPSFPKHLLKHSWTVIFTTFPFCLSSPILAFQAFYNKLDIFTIP